MNNTFRHLLEDLGEKFVCAPKAPILINAMECDIEKSNLKIAIDCANGSAYKLAPIIFSCVTDRLHVLNFNPINSIKNICR